MQEEGIPPFIMVIASMVIIVGVVVAVNILVLSLLMSAG